MSSAGRRVGVSSAQIMRAIFTLEELVASGEDRARDPLLVLGKLAEEVAGLREGRYPPVDNPRPLRDFLGILPALPEGGGR